MSKRNLAILILIAGIALLLLAILRIVNFFRILKQLNTPDPTAISMAGVGLITLCLYFILGILFIVMGITKLKKLKPSK